MNKALFGLLIVSMLLGSGGCGENAHTLNAQASTAATQEEQIRLFKKALEIDPNNQLSHFCLGWLYARQGKSDEGIAQLKKAIAINPNVEGTYLLMGELYLTKGMFHEALQAFNSVVVINPESAAGHYKRGIACNQLGKPAEAADAFFEAGILAVVNNNKDLASNAYQQLQESGNTRLAAELREVLPPWFDPAGAAAAGDRGSRLPN